MGEAPVRMRRNGSSLIFDLEDIHAGTGCEHKVSHTSIDHQQTEDLKLLTECKSPYHQQLVVAVEDWPLFGSGVDVGHLLEDLAKHLVETLSGDWTVVLRMANPATADAEMPKGGASSGDEGTVVVHSTQARISSGTREAASEILRNLRHTYILCTFKDEAQFIVDPSFAQQFDIKISTPEFKHLMRLLPPVLVLPKERVEAVVELLASAMTACFRRANIDMPPWRRADAMLSKWVPRRSLDRRQRTPPSSPRAAALPPLASPLAGHKPWATAAYEASTALGVKVGRLACRAAQPLCPSTLPLSAISSGSQLAPPPAGQLSQQIAAKSKECGSQPSSPLNSGDSLANADSKLSRQLNLSKARIVLWRR